MTDGKRERKPGPRPLNALVRVLLESGVFILMWHLARLLDRMPPGEVLEPIL